ncbi:hypothetical protein GMOD_00004957 [Pyrenophora seminiperda CCB06]|uniref:Uncharacterized protein n=1 Tax=Pyrenophora seminiperda CCB06 TaxID=1302712 RepID=A0A3M7MHY3_9PLEO|nr:hypothetical protein GMOD_00004957 [Pyrenophora seminiperda CCB06]
MASQRSQDLIQVLELFSPSAVVGDSALRTSFRQFFKKGTCIEYCELLPEDLGAQEVFTCIQSLRAPPPTAHVTAQQLHQPHTATPRDTSEPLSTTPHAATPRDDATLHDITEPHEVATSPSKKPNPAAAYFKVRYPDLKKARIETMTRIAQSTAKAGKPHRSSVFKSVSSKDPIAQAKEVYEMGDKSFLCRKTRLYFSNAVDLATLSTTKLARGQNRKDFALNQISKELKVGKKDVLETYNLGSKDLTCMEFGGPASLHYINGAKSDIIRLTDNDVEALCIYRQEKHPDIDRHYRDQDLDIAYELVSDLRVLGFTDTTIAKGNTRLTKLIGEHVDMESLVLHGVLLPRKHLNGRQVIESAMNSISVSRALVATITMTATTIVGPELEMNIGVPSNITLPGTQAPIQPDQSFQENPPTSIEPPANEHQAANREATPANGFKHHLTVGANSARKRHKTGNEDVPTPCNDTATAGHSETPCDGNVGPDGRVRQSGSVPNHQAVTACSTDAMIALQSLESSRRTSNHNSHVSSSRWGTGRAATSQRQDYDAEQEASSGDTDVDHRPQPDIMREDEQIDSTTTPENERCIHEDCQFLDIMSRVNVLQSMQHDGHGYMGVAATGTYQQPISSYASSFQVGQSSEPSSDPEDRTQLSPNTLGMVRTQYGASEHGSAGRAANSTAVSNDNELPSLWVADMRIGNERLGDVDIFSDYY